MEHENSYKRYLLQKGLSTKTIPGYINKVKRFLTWLNQQAIEIPNTEHRHLLAYIKVLQEKGLKQQSIVYELQAINHYFESCIQQGIADKNPVAFIQIQGAKQKSLHQILSREELEAIYHQYLVQDNATDKRDKAILSLMIFQGLTITDLQSLQLADLNLQTAKINITGSKHYAVRALTLEGQQVITLMEYIQEARKAILQQSKQQSTHLFISNEGKETLNNVLQNIISKLKIQNPGINAKQVRASVIVHWLKEQGLRKTQYLAGHKYISATEAYKVYCTDELAEDISKYHPLG